MDELATDLEIRKLILEEPSLQHVSSRLMVKISSSETTDLERLSYWTFLYQAGFFYETLLSMIQRLSSKGRIHWGIFVEILARLQLEPPASVIESIFKGVRRQEAKDDLWASHSWNHWDPRFEAHRQALRVDKENEAREKRENMVEKFHFLKNQRMIEQAGRVLQRLLFLFPEDPTYRELKEAFDEDWAREVIANRYKEPESETPAPFAFSPEEDRVLQDFLQTADQNYALKFESAIDFAVLFYFLEAWGYSLEFAQKAGPTTSALWLVAELLMKLRRYVDALEHLHRIENALSADPETTFGVAYLRAQALHALGQSATAVEILRNIVQVRPDYRSAQQLIAEWSGAIAG